MNNKFKGYKLMAAVLSIFLLTSCSNSAIQTNSGSKSATSSTGTSTSTSQNVIKITSDMIKYDNDDNYSDWKNQNPNYIKLTGTSVSLTGSGAAVKGGKITITAAGVYAISGKLDNGQIIVDTQDKGVVRLVLNGTDINCKEGAPIYVKNAEKTVVTLQEGTQNTITDGEKYVYSDSKEKEPDAAIFSKDSLTFNGTGTLTINAKFNNGISSKDALKITGGKISINSKDDGLIGRDMVLVKEGSISVNAAGDGIKSTNDSDKAKGFIAIQGGAFDFTTGTDAIQAETSILVSGGDFNIKTGGGSANGSVKSEGEKQAWGKWGDNAATETQSGETETPSAKALKAKSDITISGGTLKVDSSDDALNSNKSINLTGGDLTIASGDDGIHADSAINIKKGKVNITKSYEGIESMVVTISDGEIHVVSTDDGININGGKDGSSVNGRPGQNDFAAAANSMLNINGGFISIDSLGDSLDSNGSITMTNGTVVVSGPTSDNNGTLDYNGTFDMNGGFLVAAGSSGMAQAPSEESKQNSICMYYSNTQKAGTLIHLQDSKGNTVATYAPEKEYRSVVIASPLLEKNSKYTLYSGGNSTGSVAEGLYNAGAYKGGTKVVDFTITSSVTYLDENGVTTQKSFGPGGGKGVGPDGKGPRPDTKNMGPDGKGMRPDGGFGS